MRTQTQAATAGGTNARADRNTARIIGVLYLAGMVIGIGGNVLIQSVLTAANPLSVIASSGMLLAVGAVCWLVTVAGMLPTAS